MVLFQPDGAEPGRGLVARERPGVLQRIDALALRLGSGHVEGQVGREPGACLEEVGRLAQAGDELSEVGKAPGNRDTYSCRSGGKPGFKLHKRRLQVLLRLL